MNKFTLNAIYGFFALFVIATLGLYFGSGKSDPAHAEPSAVIVQPSDLDAVRLLPKEQRMQYIKPSSFNQGGAAAAKSASAVPPRPVSMPATYSDDLRIVVVRQGETLSMIALRELGDSNRYKDIMRWNNITDASTVPVGLQLQIKLEQPQLSDPMVSAATTEQSYVVQPGDFLGKISQKFYGTSKNVDMILKANNLKNANSIRVGQLLIIPAK